MACPTFGNVNYDGIPLSDDVPKLEEVLNILQIPKEVVVALYPYGSHITGLASPGSGTFAQPMPYHILRPCYYIFSCIIVELHFV